MIESWQTGTVLPSRVEPITAMPAMKKQTKDSTFLSSVFIFLMKKKMAW